MFSLPFVSRARYNDLKIEKDRIDAERVKLLDRLASLGLGGPIFEKPEAVTQPVEETAASTTPARQSVPMMRRPSQVVSQMTREAFKRFHSRRSVGQEEREIVLRQFDLVEAEVHQGQNNSKVG